MAHPVPNSSGATPVSSPLVARPRVDGCSRSRHPAASAPNRPAVSEDHKALWARHLEPPERKTEHTKSGMARELLHRGAFPGNARERSWFPALACPDRFGRAGSQAPFLDSTSGSSSALAWGQKDTPMVRGSVRLASSNRGSFCSGARPSGRRAGSCFALTFAVPCLSATLRSCKLGLSCPPALPPPTAMHASES